MGTDGAEGVVLEREVGRVADGGVDRPVEVRSPDAGPPDVLGDDVEGRRAGVGGEVRQVQNGPGADKGYSVVGTGVQQVDRAGPPGLEQRGEAVVDGRVEPPAAAAPPPGEAHSQPRRGPSARETDSPAANSQANPTAVSRMVARLTGVRTSATVSSPAEAATTSDPPTARPA